MKHSYSVLVLCAAAMATFLGGCGKPDQSTFKPTGVHPGTHLAFQQKLVAQSG